MYDWGSKDTLVKSYLEVFFLFEFLGMPSLLYNHVVESHQQPVQQAPPCYYFHFMGEGLKFHGLEYIS